MVRLFYDTLTAKYFVFFLIYLEHEKTFNCLLLTNTYSVILCVFIVDLRHDSFFILYIDNTSIEKDVEILPEE